MVRGSCKHPQNSRITLHPSRLPPARGEEYERRLAVARSMTGAGRVAKAPAGEEPPEA